MSDTAIAIAVFALKSLTLVLGALITYFAYRAYRATTGKPLGALALGFGLVTLGALLAGLTHQVLDLDSNVVHLTEASLTTLGFAIILYSLYADW